MSSRYARASDVDSKADDFIGEIKSLNSNIKWFRDYIEEHELGPAINEIADNVEAVKTVFSQVSHIEGGIGVINSLIQGLRNHAKGEKK